MSKKLSILSMILLFVFFNIGSVLAIVKIDHSKWRFVTKRGDIQISTQDVSNQSIRALKAEGVIKTPLLNVLTVLRDVSSAPLWSPFTISKDIVVEKSDLWAITHDVLKMPWPLNNRDLIVDYHLYLQPGAKELNVKFKSVQHEEFPPNGKYVRALLHFGSMRLRPSKEGTWVELIMLFDPMGHIPKWLVNALQVTMPVNYLRSLEKYSLKITKTPLPGIQKLYDELQKQY